jgi:hypothetical protein
MNCVIDAGPFLQKLLHFNQGAGDLVACLRHIIPIDDLKQAYS